MKQTAVEWLIEKRATGDLYFSDFLKAKEIEKEQIINARVNGVCEGIDIGGNYITEDVSKNHEIYYNETFKK